MFMYHKTQNYLEVSISQVWSRCLLAPLSSTTWRREDWVPSPFTEPGPGLGSSPTVSVPHPCTHSQASQDPQSQWWMTSGAQDGGPRVCAAFLGGQPPTGAKAARQQWIPGPSHARRETPQQREFQEVGPPGAFPHFLESCGHRTTQHVLIPSPPSSTHIVISSFIHAALCYQWWSSSHWGILHCLKSTMRLSI